MKEVITTIGIFILLLILCFVALFGVKSAEEKSEEKGIREEIKNYSEIVVNGETYQIEDVVNVEVEVKYYSNDIITFTLKDDSVIRIQENAYTLKK